MKSGSQTKESLAKELAGLSDLNLEELRTRWHSLYGTIPSTRLSRTMLIGAIAYKIQEEVHGGLPVAVRRFLEKAVTNVRAVPPARQLKAGTVILREWQGVTHQVTIMDNGVLYRDQHYQSLSAVARLISGIHRSGPEFFGLKSHGKT
jgi:hypothetical protein